MMKLLTAAELSREDPYSNWGTPKLLQGISEYDSNKSK